MPKGNKGKPQALPSSITSRKLIRALKKLGAKKVGRHPSGSHEMWERMVDGKTYSTPVVLETEIPRGTLQSILRKLNISEKGFIQQLGFTFVLTQVMQKFISTFVSFIFKALYNNLSTLVVRKTFRYIVIVLCRKGPRSSSSRACAHHQADNDNDETFESSGPSKTGFELPGDMRLLKPSV